METIVKNLVYQSIEPFLSEEDIQKFEEYIETNGSTQTFLGVDRKITEEWSNRIMNLPLPDWIDSEGKIWKPSNVSPVFQFRRYMMGGRCSKHRDGRYFTDGDKLISGDTNSSYMDQFKLLIYLNNLPESCAGATRIYIDKDTGLSTSKTKDFIKITPRRGHFVYYSLNLWHDGEKADSAKTLAGFRIRYKNV